MRLHADQSAALVLIAVAVTAIALTFGFDDVPAAIKQGMGPDRFPQLVAGVIIALAAVLFWQARGQTRVALEPIDRATWSVIGGAVLYMGVLWLIGLIPSLTMALIALGVLWGERRWAGLLLNAVLLPAVIWLVFVKGLKVTLPGGQLARWLGI